MKNRVGEVHTTKEGYLIKIINYENYTKCTIMFDNGVSLLVRYDHIIGKAIKNPFHPSVFGIGYLGKGDYKAKEFNKETIEYKKWKNLLTRSYDINYHNKKPTYKDVKVCEEWHNFQNFAKWFEENYIENFHLDKDILNKGNKIYSPETCCFVPPEINGLFTIRQKCRGSYPLGVSITKQGRFTSNISKWGVAEHLGIFKTIDEAFYTYKTEKEAHIKEVANKWKDKIDLKVYSALINYTVEITD